MHRTLWRYGIHVVLCLIVVIGLFHVVFPAATATAYRVVSAGAAHAIYLFDVRTGLLSKKLEVAPFDAQALRERRLPIPSSIYDAEGTKIGCFATEYRVFVPLDEKLKSSPIVLAILASEDAGFYQHGGFDLYAVARAAFGNAVGGRVESGASTLTMQLVKNFYLTSEKSYLRKAREVLLATYVEHTLTKERILELYINFVYLGGPYGIEAAAQSHFAKRAVDLSHAEAAFIAGLINYPNIFQLHGERGAVRAMSRMSRVLARMYDNGMMSHDELMRALQEPLTPTRFARACDDNEPFIRQAINRELGVLERIPLARTGLSIQTTIKRDHQRALEDGCKETLARYKERHPENAKTIRCQAISVESATGNIIALVPGQDPKRDQWGVDQSQRQAGSSFKPILYAAFFEKRLRDTLADRQRFCETAESQEACTALRETPIDLLEGCTVNDSPTAVPSIVGWRDRIVRRYVVRNYPYENRPRHRGVISCELGLAESRNAAAMWTLGQLSDTQDELTHWNESEAALVAMAERLGITSPLRHRNVSGKTEEDRAKFLPNYTLAIGSAEVTLWEMAQANIPLVNGGMSPQLSLIASLVDPYGNAREYPRRAPHKVLEPEVAWATLRALAGVVDDPLGTAYALRRKDAFPKGALCGKTGTATNAGSAASPTDNWFIGCTTEYLVVVRMNNVGKDELGKKETGGRNARPVAESYFKKLSLVDPESVFTEPTIPRREASEVVFTK